MSYRTLIFFYIVSFSLLLGGCGQTGPLYLPAPEETQPEENNSPD